MPVERPPQLRSITTNRGPSQTASSEALRLTPPPLNNFDYIRRIQSLADFLGQYNYPPEAIEQILLLVAAYNLAFEGPIPQGVKIGSPKTEEEGGQNPYDFERELQTATNQLRTSTLALANPNLPPNAREWWGKIHSQSLKTLLNFLSLPNSIAPDSQSKETTSQPISPDSGKFPVNSTNSTGLVLRGLLSFLLGLLPGLPPSFSPSSPIDVPSKQPPPIINPAPPEQRIVQMVRSLPEEASAMLVEEISKILAATTPTVEAAEIDPDQVEIKTDLLHGLPLSTSVGWFVGVKLSSFKEARAVNPNIPFNYAPSAVNQLTPNTEVKIPLHLPKGAHIESMTYIVQEGDTWESVAATYSNLPPEVVMASNFSFNESGRPLIPGEKIQIPRILDKEGNLLFIPPILRVKTNHRDTLRSIAEEIRTSVKELKKRNPIFRVWPDNAPLPDGFVLNILLEKEGGIARGILLIDYQVKEGETLESIAKHFGIPRGSLEYYNKLGKEEVSVGSTIHIPVIIPYNPDSPLLNDNSLATIRYALGLYFNLHPPGRTPHGPQAKKIDSSALTPEAEAPTPTHNFAIITLKEPKTIKDILESLAFTVTIQEGRLFTYNSETLKMLRQHNPSLPPNANLETTLPPGTKIRFPLDPHYFATFDLKTLKSPQPLPNPPEPPSPPHHKMREIIHKGVIDIKYGVGGTTTVIGIVLVGICLLNFTYPKDLRLPSLMEYSICLTGALTLYKGVDIIIETTRED